MDEQYERAREAALRILERRRRTRAQVRDRLQEKGYEPAMIEAVCDRLEEVRLLDDREYARLYLKGRRSKPKGARLLMQELRVKGISAALATEVLEEMTDEGEPGGAEAEAARALALARGSLPKLFGLPDRESRNKLYQILARRGFGMDTIEATVRQVLKERAS